MRETRGVGMTFTEVKSDIYQGGWESHSDNSDRLELPAYCELQLPFSSIGFDTPLWTVTLLGADESGKPVRIVVETALPRDPARAANRQKPTRAQTPMTASKAAAEAATPAASLAGLSVAERRRLQVLEFIFNPQDFRPFFATTEERRFGPVAGAVVTFDPRVPQALHRGLRNAAGGLVAGSLRLNSIANVQFDLPKTFATVETFRFTYVGREPRAGTCRREIVIDTLNPDSAAERTESKGQSVIARHGFVVGPGWADTERRTLDAVLGRMPEGWLGRIDGLKFNRDRQHPTLSDRGGEYAADAHTVTMYDHGFKFSLARFDAGDRAAASIAHEIGHSFDFAPLREAFDAYRAEVAATESAFSRYKLPGSDRYRIPPDREQAWESSQKRIAAATRTLEAARGLSGYRWRLEPRSQLYEAVDGGAAENSENEFRKAAALDGPVRITKYAETDWSEYFAEAFSLYVVDPVLLELLRPTIYAYFARQFPR
ncbi:MAG TPA: hypothetical protein VKH64_07560 [Candidatus Binatia bacterium]|nr:hypothetical protein [Candidatus Binatia bacterium]